MDLWLISLHILMRLPTTTVGIISPQFPVAFAFGSCVLLLDQSAVLLVEDPVAHFVILPNYEEDETVLRETLENLGCSPSAQKHMRIVSTMDLLVAATDHILRGCDGHLSSTSYF